MKKRIIFIIALIVVASLLVTTSSAEDLPLQGFSSQENALEYNELPRESGLILDWGLTIARRGTSTLKIAADMTCDSTVVKCGFKNLKVERRVNSSSPWSEYHDYGNQYVDTFAAHFRDELTVDSNYQYRVTCKHYAKKSILNTQTISNSSNIVTF